MKYIMFEDFSGDPIPIIFPNRIGHEEMREQVPYTHVLGAGYVQLRGETFACHGKAPNLGVSSRVEDAGIIQEKLVVVEK